LAHLLANLAVLLAHLPAIISGGNALLSPLVIERRLRRRRGRARTRHGRYEAEQAEHADHGDDGEAARAGGHVLGLRRLDLCLEVISGAVGVLGV
jgi:hypothetical protein